MPVMPRGFVARFIAFLVGALLVSAFVSVAGLSPDGGGMVELLYVLAGAIHLANFLLDHQDEIPTRSDRR